MNLLQLDHIRKYFGAHKAVDDISFSLQAGSIFGLLGPNGAGKTTLLRIITGIFKPDEGRVLLEGAPFDPMRDVGRIGYMPEERGLYKKMKVGEQAMYLAQLKGLTESVARKQVHHWFERLEMGSWWNKKVEDLSKGMSQKLQFVTTVLHQPRLVILDEPFSGLDPVNANLIRDEIYNLARQGSTIIFSTHRMEQVEEICDHIVLMNKGKKLLDGSVHGVRQQFKEHMFSIGFDKEPGELDSPSFSVLERKGLELVVRIHDGHNPNDVLHYLIHEQLPVRSFRELLPSLNQIFIRLVESSPAARQFESNPA